ncbi:MAG: thioesterase family protein [Spirochaetales bacterium]|nr:thioesterase family protein [Spirochaetales bacterium]
MRIEIELPEVWHFETELAVRISDVNFGGHLAHDSVLSLVHEARARFFQAHGWSELKIEGCGIIMADAALVYKAEAFFSDRLLIQLTARDFTTKGCDLVYLLTGVGSKTEIARAKTGIVFFDYERREPVEIPDGFRRIFLDGAD